MLDRCFTKVPNYFWDLMSVLSPSQKDVYLTIVKATVGCNKESRQLKIAYFIKVTGLAESTIQSAIKVLRDKYKVINVIYKNFKASVFSIVEEIKGKLGAQENSPPKNSDPNKNKGVFNKDNSFKKNNNKKINRDVVVNNEIGKEGKPMEFNQEQIDKMFEDGKKAREAGKNYRELLTNPSFEERERLVNGSWFVNPDNVDKSNGQDHSVKTNVNFSEDGNIESIDQNFVASEQTRQSLLKLLHAHYVAESVANRLIDEYPEQVIRNQIEWLSYRKFSDRAAFLVNAIKNNYDPPKQIQEAIEATRSDEKKEEIDNLLEIQINQLRAKMEGKNRINHRGQICRFLKSSIRDGILWVQPERGGDYPIKLSEALTCGFRKV